MYAIQFSHEIYLLLRRCCVTTANFETIFSITSTERLRRTRFRVPHCTLERRLR